MLKQNLQQKLLQKLSPQQLQFIKLLQIPTTSLDERIKEELEANPALEDGSLSTNTQEDDTYDLEAMPSTTQEDKQIEDPELNVAELLDAQENSYNLYSQTDPDSASNYENRSSPIAFKNSFQDTLLAQIKMQNFNKEDFKIAQQLLGSLDDDGYLRRPLGAICDDLLFSSNLSITEERTRGILQKIQQLDPPGIAATSLQECLLIQLKKKLKHKPTTALTLAIKIIEVHLEEFTHKHYDKLVKLLKVTEKDLKSAIDEILKLNPKPGETDLNLGGSQLHIMPDFTIRNVDGDLLLNLNSRNAPQLHINKDYREMLCQYRGQGSKDKKARETALFVKQKIEAAKWFIDAIKQRQQTLLKVMNAIMEFQYEYFISGDERNLKPMILKDIADKIHMDISTVSRVANSKYVQTNFGIFLLKNFFSEGIQRTDGKEVSNKEVKKILQEYISNENKTKPLSDSKLATILKNANYNVARRTVAKYREQLGIPIARLRKQL